MEETESRNRLGSADVVAAETHDFFEQVMLDSETSMNCGRSELHGSIGWEDDYSLMAAPRRSAFGLSASISEEFLSKTCWVSVDMGHSSPDMDQDRRGGLTTHRGVLPEGTWVDDAELERLLGKFLPVSVRDIHFAYKMRGRPPKLDSPAGQLRCRIRAKMDPIFMELVDTGSTNIDLLARALGLGFQRIYQAADRARGCSMQPASACSPEPATTTNPSPAVVVAEVTYRHRKLPNRQFASREAMLAAL